MATLNVKNLPEELHRKLKRRAKEERRSIASHVRWLIEQDSARPKRYTVDDLKGLGAEIWKDVDIEEYIRKERDSW
jgi:plasmid stability protein